MRRRFVAVGLFIPGIVVLWLLAATLGAVVPGRVANINGAPSVRVGLVAGLIHYDFLVPARPDVLTQFGFVEASGVPIRLPQVQYLVIGWGAHDFYTTTGSYQNLSARAIWRGIIGDASVMRVDVAGAIDPDIPVQWLDLSDAQFSALLVAIESGFAPEHAALDTPGFTDSDRFFVGAGSFSALRTCNVWVGEVLRAAGLRFGAWTPAPYSVRLSLWWFDL